MTPSQPGVRAVTVAWAAGWALAAAGMSISDIYSSPHRGLLATYALGGIGWGIGAAATICHLRRCGASGPVIALSIAGWCVGALTAVLLGQTWGTEWNPAFLGPIASAALGGTVGGAFTLQPQSLSLPASPVRLALRSAFGWGASFLVFQVIAFYTGYILMQMTVDPLVPVVGHVLAKVPGWAIPAGLGGFLAARSALRFQGSAG